MGEVIVITSGKGGVGKTTTIAKIASKFKVEQDKKVAFLTADTYRIAAAEQLRTYANILEVPFRVIYSVEELQSSLKDFKWKFILLSYDLFHGNKVEFTVGHIGKGFVH